MILGAHVSASGGIYKSVERAYKIGASCFQIFGSPPQSFKSPSHSQEDINKFNSDLEKHKLGSVFFHGAYLINLAAGYERLYELSIESLIQTLNLSSIMKVEGVIFHIGSHKGDGFKSVFNRIVMASNKVLSQTKTGKLIFENNAGQGGGVGTNFSELGEIINSLSGYSKRVGVCLDSQHAFASGYNIATECGVTAAMGEFDRLVGKERLMAIHLNDSKVELGSKRDRHENLGSGKIGIAGLKNFLKDKHLSNLPIIIETPGFVGNGPDKENMDILKTQIAP